jgi:DNA-binding transcriptional regulator LsrR (DeoR family)
MYERMALDIVAGQARPAIICKTSVAQIAARCGLNHSVVKDALREAAARKILTIEPQWNFNACSAQLDLVIDFVSPKPCAALRFKAAPNIVKADVTAKGSACILN